MKTSLIVSGFILMMMTVACNSEKKEGTFQTQDALENIFARKSVRKYLPKPVEKEKTDLLLKAGMAAPTGKDTRPWEFVVVTKRAALDSMAAALPYAKMLKDAPMAIVVCGIQPNLLIGIWIVLRLLKIFYWRRKHLDWELSGRQLIRMTTVWLL